MLENLDNPRGRHSQRIAESLDDSAILTPHLINCTDLIQFGISGSAILRPTAIANVNTCEEFRLTETRTALMVNATFVREKRMLRNFITLIVGWRALAGSA